MSRSQKPSRQVSVDEQIQVVLAVLKGELSLAEAARRSQVSDSGQPGCRAGGVQMEPPQPRSGEEERP